MEDEVGMCGGFFFQVSVSIIRFLALALVWLWFCEDADTLFGMIDWLIER